MKPKAKEGNIDLFYMDVNKKQNKRAEKKSAPKSKVKANVKNKDVFDFDNEIVIGISNKEKEEMKKSNNKKQLNKKNTKKGTSNNKKTNNKKNKSKVILFIIKWTILVAMLIAAIIFLFTTPIFNIKEIHVIGNDKISNEEIVSLSKLQLEENLFNNRKSNIIKAIKENPYVESVQVKRKIPDVIELIINERKATYCIQILNSYAYINEQGYILEISEQKPNLPLLKGTKTLEEELVAGGRICLEDLEKLPTLYKIIESAKNIEISDMITTTDFTNVYEYNLYLESKNKTVHLGDASNLTNKMLYVKAILDAEEGHNGEIFVNGNLNEEFKPFFREQV